MKSLVLALAAALPLCALAALGRNGVPVYAFYLPGREPQLLPEVLTREAILAVLERN